VLLISRKLFALPLDQVYFQEFKYDSRYEPKIVCYTHILKPSRKLHGKKTLHIDLKQYEPDIFPYVSGKEIHLINENWNISRFTHPTDKEIEEFQQFYNEKAKQMNARKLSNFDIQTMKLLREQGGLILTKVENEQKESIYYRAYVVGKEMVMALYNDIHDLTEMSTKQGANYFLCCENMKHFCDEGYKIYDFGDIKELTKLEQLKEAFDGKLVTVFSGYISKSFFSQMLLQLNLKGLKKRLSY